MAPDTIDCTLLLPRSGVGVSAPWLVIAPPAADQMIGLDLRLLDRIELVDPAESPDESHNEEATSTCAKSQGSDHVDLLLVCGDLEIALFIADGPDATWQVAEQAAVHTREVTKLTSSGNLERFVVVDEDPVLLRGDFLQVGNLKFRIHEVREYAVRGANIPLTQGRLLQAAMAMLVVAAAERDAAAPA